MKRLAIVLVACSTPPVAQPRALPVDKPVCKFASDDAAKLAFIKAAALQIEDEANSFVPEGLDPDYVDPNPLPPPEPGQPAGMHSLVDPGLHLTIDYPASLPNVITVVWQFGYDGIYPLGVAGVFVDCTYYPLAKHALTPDETEPSPRGAMLALGWQTLAGDAKLSLAKTFVLDVLATTIQPIEKSRDDDFGATFTDGGTTTTTPKFTPPTVTWGNEGAVRVEFWTAYGSGMGGTEDDGNGYRKLRYTIRGDGAIVVKQVEDFIGPRQSLKHPK